MNISAYHKSLIAEIYDIIYQHSYHRHATFYEKIIRSLQPPGNKLFDLCCGTGGHLKEYKRLGFEVTGLDLSDAMLARARNRVAENLFQGDMRSFSSEEKYDIVICHSFSILHNATLHDLAVTAANVFGILQNRGLFVFDIIDKHIDTNSLLIDRTDGNSEHAIINPQSELFSIYGDEFELCYDIRWIYEESKDRFFIIIEVAITGQQGLFRTVERIEQGAFSIPEVINLLQGIGFEVLDFSMTSDAVRISTEDEKRAILVARKL